MSALYAFKPGDVVRIRQAPDIEATVDVVAHHRDGSTSYSVVWWHNGDRASAIVCGFELELVP